MSEQYKELLKKYIEVVYSKTNTTFTADDNFSEEEVSLLDSLKNEMFSKTWEQGSSSYLLRGDGWILSFKTPDMYVTESKDIPETCLIDSVKDEYYVLDGDHRSSFLADPTCSFNEQFSIYNQLKNEQ